MLERPLTCQVFTPLKMWCPKPERLIPGKGFSSALRWANNLQILLAGPPAQRFRFISGSKLCCCQSAHLARVTPPSQQNTLRGEPACTERPPSSWGNALGEALSSGPEAGDSTGIHTCNSRNPGTHRANLKLRMSVRKNAMVYLTQCHPRTKCRAYQPG